MLDQLRPRRVDAGLHRPVAARAGADRIIWASDYPHPDAKFPGVTEELTEALEGLDFAQQQAITSESAIALYGIGD